jgi:hypothetical protein
LWAAACTFGLALAGRGGPRLRLAVFSILAVDAAVQFSVPLFSGTRGEARAMDLAPVGFLKTNLGLNRFYTLGPIYPNYAAFDQVAGIDHIYAPVPRDWVNTIRASLDPHADPVTFNGSYPPPTPGEETRAEALLHHLAGYEGVGVKYVVTPSGVDPFAITPATARAMPGMQALPLHAGDSLSTHIRAGEYGAGQFSGVGMLVGTYGGSADGRLRLKICAGGACAAGSAELAGVGDNSNARITLDRALTVRAGDALDVSLTREGGRAPLALWLWRGPEKPDAHLPKSVDVMPGMVLFASGEGKSIRLAFRSRMADIYELPRPAPYFEAPQCTISDAQRTALQARCDRPAMLTRRELWFPGWTAEVNGQSVPVSKADIFQAIALPAGQSTIRFDYAPPGVGLAFVAAAFGALMMFVPKAAPV